MRLLAADIGGTKSLLALYEVDAEGVRELRRKRFPNAVYSSFEAVLTEFLGGDSVETACLGIAGPVENNRCAVTNLPWTVDGVLIAANHGMRQCDLINDFVATGYGVTALQSGDTAVLNEAPVDPRGHVAVLGAGTGLGEACIVRGEHESVVLATEAGHADFAARNEDEIALLRFLAKRQTPVCVEHVLSGAGIVSLYEFAVAERKFVSSPQVRARLSGGDKAATIAALGLANEDRACVMALEMFVSALGAEAGNFALRTLPRGGMYVAGGIAPKLRALVTGPLFRDSFLAKHKHSELLKTIPVHLVLTEDVGLVGARTHGMAHLPR